MHGAAGGGHAAVVAALLNAGANPRAANNAGRTPYLVAKESRCRELLWKAMMEMPIE